MDVCQHMRFCVCVWCVCVYPHMHMYVLMLLGKEEEGEEITLFPVHHIPSYGGCFKKYSIERNYTAML